MSTTQTPTRRALLQAAAGAGAGFGLHPLLGSLANAQPASGKTLTVAIPGVPVTLDPINLTNHDWMAASQTIYENLIEFDVNGEMRPQLAAAMPTALLRCSCRVSYQRKTNNSSIVQSHGSRYRCPRDRE